MLRRQSLPPLIRHAFGVPPSPRGRLFFASPELLRKIKIKHTFVLDIPCGKGYNRFGMVYTGIV